MEHEQDKPQPFHASPTEALDAPPEESSTRSSTGTNVGHELHHLGWNRCSSPATGRARRLRSRRRLRDGDLPVSALAHVGGSSFEGTLAFAFPALVVALGMAWAKPLARARRVGARGRAGDRTLSPATTTLAISLAVSCGAVGPAVPASAAVDCDLAGTTLTVTMSADGDASNIVRSGGSIHVREGGSTVACTGGAPTVTNTDLVVVNDTSGQDTEVLIDAGGGAFAPGATDEAGVTDEVELSVDLGAGGADSLSLATSQGGDVWRLGDTAAGDGVNLNARGETSGVVPGRDFDLEFSGVEGRLEIFTIGPGGHSVDASGGPEFTGGLSRPLVLTESFGAGPDTVVGTAGDDIFFPGGGDDTIAAGDGDDRYIDRDLFGDDDVDGGPGVDSYELAEPTEEAFRVDLRVTGRQDTGSRGRDALTGIENVSSGDGDDVLIGSDASNTLIAGAGDDVVQGLGGPSDLLGGGDGVDTLSYAGATGGVTVDLEAGAQSTGGAGTDVLNGFENVIGGPFADTLFGGANANRFEVRDGVGDQVSCRGDADVVVADVEGLDALAGDCEGREFDVRPETSITSGPETPSRNATPTFAFTSSKAGSTFECSLDGEAFAACESPRTLGPVPDGVHQFAVRARDMLGALDLTPATYAFTVDTSAAAAQGSPPAGDGATPAFGSSTLVLLELASERIAARGPVSVRVINRNGFEVTGRLSGRRGRLRLEAKPFRVRANARATVRLKLPRALRRLLQRQRRLSIRVTASVKDPTGAERTVSRVVRPKLRRRRR